MNASSNSLPAVVENAGVAIVLVAAELSFDVVTSMAIAADAGALQTTRRDAEVMMSRRNRAGIRRRVRKTDIRFWTRLASAQPERIAANICSASTTSI